MKPSLTDALRARPEQRRAFERYKVSLTVLVQPVPEDGAGARRGGMVSAIVTDLSLSGLVFVSRRPHPPGSIVEVQISLGAHVYLIHAVVKRSQVLALPGRRAFQCAAQLVRGEAVARYIPALARYLYCRFGPNSSQTHPECG